MDQGGFVAAGGIGDITAGWRDSGILSHLVLRGSKNRKLAVMKVVCLGAVVLGGLLAGCQMVETKAGEARKLEAGWVCTTAGEPWRVREMPGMGTEERIAPTPPVGR